MIIKFAPGLVIMATILAVPAAAVQPGDQNFVLDAAQAGKTEVALGKIAARKSTNPEVKQLASTMISDHTKANDSLKRIATTNRIAIPSKFDAEHASLINKFSTLDGRDFDGKYVHQMVSDHKRVLNDLRAETTTDEPELKHWADRMLPIVEGHLKMAEDLDKALEKQAR